MKAGRSRFTSCHGRRALNAEADRASDAASGLAKGFALVHGTDDSGKQYFHVRPSATVPPYNAGATTFANLGPTNPALAKAVKANIASVLKLEGPYNPGLTAAGIPVDAVTTSGSGIDPDITPAYADLQAKRIAAVRGIPLDEVEGLISQHTDGRFLGFLGEPGVNVLRLNLALDEVNH